MVKEGDKAPDFDLEGVDGKRHSLTEFRGKRVVLYFYPKDDTPGCTVEACDFQSLSDKAWEKNAVIIGVSPDSIESHGKFAGKYKLNFLLLADEEHEACQAYGVWVEKNLYGKKFFGVNRSTFVIDEKGVVVKALYGVNPLGHAGQVIGTM